MFIIRTMISVAIVLIACAATPAQTVTDTVTLNGSATDDGYPIPPNLTYAWTKKGGPGTVVFGDATKAVTTARFTIAGVYVLTLTVSDGQLSNNADTTITVLPKNQPPSVNAGPNQTIQLPAQVSLNGTILDDGYPNPPGQVTSLWTLIKGKQWAVRIENKLQPRTIAYITGPGKYMFRLSASDSRLSAYDDVEVVVSR
jgi:hypothetical protein